jgi:UDP-hydrolysing UDP-N-acetyl-D-glucosamine 2-epimerase
MGEDPATVFVTGCPSIDLAASILEDSELDFDPFKEYGGVGAPVDVSNGYLVVIQHPVTTEFHEARCQVTETLYSVRDLEIPTLWFWPNVDAGSDGTSKGIRAFRENEHVPDIHFFKNMAPEDFLRLVFNSRCIVGNSSVAIRECSFLGVPAVNIGTRQAGRERGRNVVDADYNRAQIAAAIRYHLRNGRLPSDPLYGDGAAGKRIADLLAQVALNIEKRLAYESIDEQASRGMTRFPRI